MSSDLGAQCDTVLQDCSDASHWFGGVAKHPRNGACRQNEPKNGALFRANPRFISLQGVEKGGAGFAHVCKRVSSNTQVQDSSEPRS